MKGTRSKSRISTKGVLMLLFVLMLIIPYGTTSIYLMYGMQQQLRSNASAAIESDLERVQNALDEMLVEAERVSYLHLVDNSIASILQKDRSSYDYEYYTDEQTMQNAIKHTSSLNSNILSVTFFSLGGDTYCLNQLADNQTVRHGDWLRNALLSEDHTYIAPLQHTLSGKQSLPLVFALYNSQCTQLVGYVQIDYDIDACLSSARAALKNQAGMAVWQKDTLILDSAGNADLDALDALPVNTAGRARMNGGYYTTAWTLHAPSGLTVPVYQTGDSEGSSIMHSIYLYMVLLAVMLFLAIFLGWFVVSSVGRSLTQLSFALDGVQHGMNELIDVPKNSIIGAELNQLMHSYNALSERLTRSTEQEYQLRLEQQRATMRALENQVNPHFLYNSLNLIASLTQLGETDTIHTVTLNLADVMRYCIKGGSLVTLEEELCQTGKYIFIMGKRFPDKLTIALRAEPGLDGCRIPKLLLQPLIENSVIYGLESGMHHLHVAVDVRRDGDDLVMTVEDDGPGIDPAKLEDILGRIEAFNASRINRDEQSGSIGLFNVHARVFARYGAGYGVVINSRPGCCRVTVRLPAQPCSGQNYEHLAP